jgi:hypothetical protein
MKGFDAAQDGLRGLAGELLVADGFDQSLERRLLVIGLQLAGGGGVDEAGKNGVCPAEVLDGLFVHGGSAKKLA